MPHESGATPWRPSASLETLRKRAALLARTRAFFAQRGVLEVETPLLSRNGNPSPAIDSMSCETGDGRRYLHTSPEFAMKRLLAAGSGPIYQICKVFRQGERGRRHSPEFTLLEWYRPGMDYRGLMDEVDELLQHLLNTPVSEKLTYAQLFRQHLGLDIHHASQTQLQACATQHGLDARLGPDDDLDCWRDLLLSHLIEPRLGWHAPLFVYDYPASQAALARVRPGPPALAERFELYMQGIEIANGYQELTDPAEQRQRFLDEQRQRQRQGRESPPVDEALLAALSHGLPACSGVALGVDRLLMLWQGIENIDETLSFSWQRA